MMIDSASVDSLCHLGQIASNKKGVGSKRDRAQELAELIDLASGQIESMKHDLEALTSGRQRIPTRPPDPLLFLNSKATEMLMDRDVVTVCQAAAHLQQALQTPALAEKIKYLMKAVPQAIQDSQQSFINATRSTTKPLERQALLSKLTSLPSVISNASQLPDLLEELFHKDCEMITPDSGTKLTGLDAICSYFSMVYNAFTCFAFTKYDVTDGASNGEGGDNNTIVIDWICEGVQTEPVFNIAPQQRVLREDALPVHAVPGKAIISVAECGRIRQVRLCWAHSNLVLQLLHIPPCIISIKPEGSSPASQQKRKRGASGSVAKNSSVDSTTKKVKLENKLENEQDLFIIDYDSDCSVDIMSPLFSSCGEEHDDSGDDPYDDWGVTSDVREIGQAKDNFFGTADVASRSEIMWDLDCRV